MIGIRVEVYRQVIVSLVSDGHALDSEGSADFRIACAGVSSALRSFAELLGSRTDIRARGSAPEPGRFCVDVVSVARMDWYRGVSELLMTSLRLVQRDYPAHVAIEFVEVEGFAEVG